MLQRVILKDDLYLIRHELPFKVESAKPRTPVHWIIVFDCSGSMSGVMSQMREHLKTALPNILHSSDQVSLVWFSGKNQCGTVFEFQTVKSLIDLQEMKDNIDTWLRPIGLTGFLNPLHEVERLAVLTPLGTSNALIFMSDGCDNQWNRDAISHAIQNLQQLVQSATVVEYGYYADRAMLSEMAATLNGTHVFASNEEDWYRTLSSAFDSNVEPNWMNVELACAPLDNFAFTITDKIQAFDVGDKLTVNIPVTTRSIFYITNEPARTLFAPLAHDATHEVAAAKYAALSLYAARMKPDVIFPLLRSTGDRRFIYDYTSCFGKQAYTRFMQEAEQAALQPHLRLVDGYDPNLVPREDAFSIVELLQLLLDDKDCRILVDNPAFVYNRIGRKRLDANSVLTVDEQRQLDELTAQMIDASKRRDATAVKTFSAVINTLTGKKPYALKFVAEPAPLGIPIDSIVLNESRPNISIHVHREGTIDLSSRPEIAAHLPDPQFPTKKHATYTIIKDGLVHVQKLPVAELSDQTHEAIATAIINERAPFGFAPVNNDIVTFNLTRLPIINRSMLRSISAKELFELEWELLKTEATQKVYKFFREQHLRRETSNTLRATYGVELASALNEAGFTDHGFNPRSVTAESCDFYMGKELHVAISGFSSFPSVASVEAKMSGKGAITPASAIGLMATAIQECRTQQAHQTFDAWIAENTRRIIAERRALLARKAKMVFVVIVGQTWFPEFPGSPCEGTMTLELGGEKRKCTVELHDIEIKI